MNHASWFLWTVLYLSVLSCPELVVGYCVRLIHDRNLHEILPLLILLLVLFNWSVLFFSKDYSRSG